MGLGRCVGAPIASGRTSEEFVENHETADALIIAAGLGKYGISISKHRRYNPEDNR
ncbi:MAG: hypothetical protein U9N35_04395 [Euryarchaeota archaeon]|nr:hypothetical protein [Euryarchaeota archaeon]